MKQATFTLYEQTGMAELGYDWMGYEFKRTSELSFHHLVIPKRDCVKLHMPVDGYVEENGAILVQESSHEYTHLVEKIDPDRFYYITGELIEINEQRKILLQNLMHIHDCLNGFEREFSTLRAQANLGEGFYIKEEYTRRRVDKWR